MERGPTPCRVHALLCPHRNRCKVYCASSSKDPNEDRIWFCSWFPPSQLMVCSTMYQCKGGVTPGLLFGGPSFVFPTADILSRLHRRWTLSYEEAGEIVVHARCSAPEGELDIATPLVHVLKLIRTSSVPGTIFIQLLGIYVHFLSPKGLEECTSPVYDRERWGASSCLWVGGASSPLASPPTLAMRDCCFTSQIFPRFSPPMPHVGRVADLCFA